MMLIVALVLLGIAALGGATAAAMRVRAEENPPLPLALVHGGMAASGLVVLGLYAFQSGFPVDVSVALGLLVLSALGGFALFAGHLRGTLLHLGLVAVHACAAVAGVAVLLWVVVRGG